jgi:hypothetical protein
MRRAGSIFFAAAALAGGACSDAGPSESYVKIDDMEGVSGFIQWTPPGGMNPGLWTADTACTETQRIVPPAYYTNPYGWTYAELPTPHQTLSGVVSTHAARLRTTTPLQGVWGADIAFDFVDPLAGDGGVMWPPASFQTITAPGDPSCMEGMIVDGNGDATVVNEQTLFDASTVDISAYSGFTFWAMAASGGDQSVRLIVNDVNTDPRGGVCDAGDPSDQTNCWNGFGVTLALTDTWARYRVELSNLQQDPSWGYHPTPSVPDLRQVYGMVFQVNAPTCGAGTTSMCAGGPPPTSFDFWIDDLYFVSR